MMICNFLLGLWSNCYVFFLIHIFLSPKEYKKIQFLIIFLFFSILNGINLALYDPILTLIFHIIISFSFLFIIYANCFYQLFSLIISVGSIRYIFETLLKLILFILKITIPSYSIQFIFTSLVTLIFIYFAKDYIIENLNMKSLSKTSIKKKLLLYNIIFICIIIENIPFSYLRFSNPSFITLLFTFIIFNLSTFLLNEKSQTEEYIKNHKKTVEYSKFTEDLLTEYKSFLHEYKNKLIIIRSLANPENTELLNYIDNELTINKNTNYQYLMEIKNIPISGIKGLINFKLIKMRELGINTEIYVAENMNELNNKGLNVNDKNSLYTILGIILDNAIEASIDSQDKMVSLQLYLDEEKNKDITIIVANTFKSIDITRIEEKGFSSKGENRGLGLYIVKEIIKRNNNLKKETSIISNFFVQKIIIKNPN